MKFLHLSLLVLVCLAVSVSTTETSASELPCESSPSTTVNKTVTTIHNRSKSTDGIYRDQNGSVYYEKTGDVVYEWTETDGIDAIVTDFTHEVPITSVVDGKIITVYKRTKVMSDHHTKFKKVKKMWSGEKVIVPSVSRVLESFGEFIGKLTEDEYALFSHIATTDYNKYWSDYNFWEVNDMDLGLALSKLWSVYKSTLRSEDIDIAVEAIQKCDDGYVALVLDSQSVDINNQDGWTIYSEFFAATCSQKSNKNQIFAWAASKSGGYLPGAFSQSNANTVTYIVKKWLLMHLPLLVSCKSSPVKKMHVWQVREDTNTATASSTSSATSSATDSATLSGTASSSSTASATSSSTASSTASATNTETSSSRSN
jgi:predicted PolB exonuclease-like 3'-5' exonuclease